MRIGQHNDTLAEGISSHRTSCITLADHRQNLKMYHQPMQWNKRQTAADR